MDNSKIFHDFEIDPASVNADFTVHESALPKQRVDGKIITKAGRYRCMIEYQTIENQGRYGIIQTCKRTDTDNLSKSVVVKRPRSPSISLAPEAILQGVCYDCLEINGLAGSISKIHDLFLFANEVRFSMEFIDGISFKEFIKSHTGDEIINCIMQLCYILYILERDLNFDHRDLRIENVWIRPLTSTQTYTIQIENLPDQILEFNFQVVLLDFGFACIGDNFRKTIVNLGDNVFTPIDPCPKSGRDMYQFLISCFENRIQDHLFKDFTEFIIKQMKPYTIIPSALSYITTYDPKFELNNLKPGELLRWYFRNA